MTICEQVSPYGQLLPASVTIFDQVYLDGQLLPTYVTRHYFSQVYVVERMSAEGRFFHRSCFRCDYCGILLRLGSYVHHRSVLLVTGNKLPGHK